jgi:hypothetical protein
MREEPAALPCETLVHVQSTMREEFTEAKKAKVLSMIRIRDGKILPEQEDLLHFLKKKVMDHKVYGHIHKHLIKFMENISAVDTLPARSHMFHIFDDPKDYEEVLHGCHHLYGVETTLLRQHVREACTYPH